MLHCGGGNHPIHYISDYKMTVLARYIENKFGQTVIETFWAGTGALQGGPVIFVSALDAEIIRQIENTSIPHNENQWERWELSRIDLPQMISMMGGTLHVHIFNAFVASQQNSLITPNHRTPRMSLIPMVFSDEDTPPQGAHITFKFDESYFESLREYWQIIMKDEYAESIEELNNSSDEELSTLAKKAIASVQITPVQEIQFGLSDQLALFSPLGQKWKFTKQDVFNSQQSS